MVASEMKKKVREQFMPMHLTFTVADEDDSRPNAITEVHKFIF